MNKLKLYSKLIGEDILKFLKWLIWVMLEIFIVLFLGILFFKGIMIPRFYEALRIIAYGSLISLIFLVVFTCVIYIWFNISFYIEDLKNRANDEIKGDD